MGKGKRRGAAALSGRLSRYILVIGWQPGCHSFGGIMLINIFKPSAVVLLAAGLMPFAALAQNAFDTSADATLVGKYFVRELLLTKVSAAGTVGQARSATGIVTFSTQGTYSFNGQIMDSTVLPAVPSDAAMVGTFGVATNGFLQMQSLLGTANNNPDMLRGGVGTAGPSAFVASTTEGPNYDEIVGIPIATGVSVSTLSGLYSFAYLDFFGGQASQVRNAWFTLNALGTGVAGFAVQVTGSAADISNKTFTQYSGNVSYTLSDADGGAFTFPTNNASDQLISGTKVFYVSRDGNLVVGGAVDGYDLLVGTPPVTGTGASDAGMLSFYYLAGLEANATQFSQGTEPIDCFYGSSSATTNGLAINHERTNQLGAEPADATFNLGFTVASDGTFQPAGRPYRYALGAKDMVLLGSGTNGQYSLIVGLARPFSANSAVFLNPVGVVNAASYAPATNPVAPSEIILLFGKNLAQTSATASLPLPVTLAATQVMINGAAIPLFSVSPTLIVAQVPARISPVFGITFATFEVVNNTIPSNPVTLYVRGTAPGVFAANAGGVGPAAALHGNGALVTDANPATTGETVELFTTGLGSVTPGVPDGAGGQAPPHASLVDGKPVLTIGGIQASNVPYAGLAPGYAGLYQVNVQVPSGTSSGDLTLSISTADGNSVQTTLSVQAAH
jgi:uncharacterized protein (TIGR03437 family)